MMKLLKILLLILVVNPIFSQTPFTTLMREPRLLKKVDLPNGKTEYKMVFEPQIIKNYLNYDRSINREDYTEVSKTNIQFFKNNNLSLNLANKGENRLSLNSDIIHYKLYLFNPTDKNEYRLRKLNLPLLLVSKISSFSDSITKSSAYDILDYNGSPLTLRIMPSFLAESTKITDVLYYGIYTDLRGIQTSAEKINLEYIWSTGLGFTFQGDSQGAKFSENGNYDMGRYSLSAIYQFATGNKQLLTNHFNTEKNFVSSIQLIFVIKLNNDSPLNLRVGYQYYFENIRNGSKSNFSLALGI